MSFKRIFRWHCDTCGIEVEREAYQMPEGWHYIKQKVLAITRRAGHACPKCSELYPDSDKSSNSKL